MGGNVSLENSPSQIPAQTYLSLSVTPTITSINSYEHERSCQFSESVKTNNSRISDLLCSPFPYLNIKPVSPLIPQFDGNNDSDSSSVNSEDQLDPINAPDVFVATDNGKLVIDQNALPPALPLFAVANLRSAFNKVHSIHKLVSELGIEVLLAVETWERNRIRLSDILPPGYKYSSVFRHKTTGGGCAVIYNDSRIHLTTIDYINVPEGVEAIWGMIKPLNKHFKVKYICFAAIYISPKSR